MSSILKVDQLQGLTSSTVTDINDLKFQIATAWVNFDGTGTVSIRDSYNVSSITDNGTGDYTVNFTASFATANYCPVFGYDHGGATDSTSFGKSASAAATVSAIRTLYTIGASPTDRSYLTVSIFGGL